MYNFTLYLTSVLDVVGGQHHTLAPLPLKKRPGTHFTNGYVGTKAGLEGWG